MFEREEAARRNLIGSCMRLQGFELHVAEDLDADAGWRALSREQQDAYNLALYGTTTPNSDRVQERAGGCLDKAYALVPGSANLGRELQEAWLTARLGFDKRPDLVEATSRWSTCMRQGGFDYASDRTMTASADRAIAAGTGGRVDTSAAEAYGAAHCTSPLQAARVAAAADVEAQFAAAHSAEVEAIKKRNADAQIIVDANQ